MTVTTGGLPGTAAASTVGSEVTFDTSKNPNATVMAINAGHEGTHVMDNLDPRSSTSPLPNFSYEYRGYETSAWVAQGLHLGAVGSGDYNIYTPGRGFNSGDVMDLIIDKYSRKEEGANFMEPLPYLDP